MTPASTTLTQRIKAEFEARSERLRTAQDERLQHIQQREEKIERFNRACDDLKDIWLPRFEEFAKQFGDKINIRPVVQPSQREARVSFLTDLANMTLTLTASVNPDADLFALDYDLLIIPMFLEYDRHARLELPLARVDRTVVGRWIDDQLISCVKTYLSMQDNEMYIKRASVEDPVSGVRFLKSDAAATFEHHGRVLHFETEQTLRQYKQKHQLAT